jgi:hypothetical protein
MPSRLAVLSLFAVAACTPAPYTIVQHGLVAAPRPATYDGQPLTTRSRVEGHASTTTVTAASDSPAAHDSGAAVARHAAGGAVRTTIKPDTDIGLEVDGSWFGTATTLAGDNSMSTGVPDAAVVDAVVALRTSIAQTPSLRVGVAFALGGSSIPIHRDGTTVYSRDESLIARLAIVPSYRFEHVTVYGSVGGSTQSDIEKYYTVTPTSTNNNDPGVIAEASQLVVTLAAGATIDLGNRAHLNAQIADVLGQEATFGPQVTAGLAFDLGDPMRH